MIGQICKECYYFEKDGSWCNRLVHSQIGMRDRVGSDYCKGDYCPYLELGESKPSKGSRPMFGNS